MCERSSPVLATGLPNRKSLKCAIFCVFCSFVELRVPLIASLQPNIPKGTCLFWGRSSECAENGTILTRAALDDFIDPGAAALHLTRGRVFRDPFEAASLGGIEMSKRNMLLVLVCFAV